MEKKLVVRRAVELFIVIAIFIVIIGKIFFADSSAIFFLFFYGISVTIVTWFTFIVALFFYKDPYKLALKNDYFKDKQYFVSCMVAVRNEEGHISRCLDSMINQSYFNKEIIVVNDASTDNTLTILKEYERRGQIILIDLKNNVGKKRALGRAMAIAKGEIYAHTDSDSTWAPDAIEKIIKIFNHFEDVGAVSGHGRALNGEKNILTKAQDAWMEGQFSVRKAFESYFGAVTCVSGPLAVFRKEAIYNFIPAWENDTFLGQEFKFATDRTLTGFVLGNKSIGNKYKRKYADSHFVKYADYPLRNWKIVYCRSAKSWTIVPDTFKRLIRQQIRWKKSFIRNTFFTGSFYWKKPLPTALVYYLHILFVLFGPVIAFRHLIYLPVKGNILSVIFYLAGIIFIGFMFGLACKLANKESSRWIYRPIMNIISTFFISWLIFYSALTIKKMVWSRN